MLVVVDKLKDSDILDVLNDYIYNLLHENGYFYWTSGEKIELVKIQPSGIWIFLNIVFLALFILTPYLKRSKYFEKLPNFVWLIVAAVFNFIQLLRVLSEVEMLIQYWSASNEEFELINTIRNDFLIVGIIILLIYIFSGRILYIVNFSGGRMAFRADWIGITQCKRFNNVLHQQKDYRREEVR